MAKTTVNEQLKIVLCTNGRSTFFLRETNTSVASGGRPSVSAVEICYLSPKILFPIGVPIYTPQTRCRVKHLTSMGVFSQPWRASWTRTVDGTAKTGWCVVSLNLQRIRLNSMQLSNSLQGRRNRFWSVWFLFGQGDNCNPPGRRFCAHTREWDRYSTNGDLCFGRLGPVRGIPV